MKNPFGKITDRLKGKWDNILIAVGELVLGILLLTRPVGFTAVVVIAFGVLCLALAVKSAVGYFRTDIILASKRYDLFKALLLTGVGIYLLVKSVWIAKTQDALTVLYGIVLLIIGAQKIQWTVNLLRGKKPFPYLAGISAGLTVALGIIVWIDPFPETWILWLVLGISLLVIAAVDVLALVLIIRGRRQTPPVSETDTVTME